MTSPVQPARRGPSPEDVAKATGILRTQLTSPALAAAVAADLPTCAVTADDLRVEGVAVALADSDGHRWESLSVGHPLREDYRRNARAAIAHLAPAPANVARYTTLVVVVDTDAVELVTDALSHNEHVWFAGTETVGVSAAAIAAGALPEEWA